MTNETTVTVTVAFVARGRKGKHWRDNRRKKERYRRERRELIAQLGGACKDCGGKRRLEFDHLKPRTWDTRKLHRIARLKRYREEAAAGLIELRCRSCNASKGKPE